VSRFERDTGIAARFTTDLADITLPPRVCHELVRIVQEALVNVRKHGAAHHVMVRLAARDGRIRLEIDDDGRGFAFEGQLTHVELDALRRGPRVIKERVRAIGGELTVDSAPGRGATLRITVPQEAHG
jgi:signal transduction histidine kinase